MAGAPDDAGGPLSPFLILLLVVALQVLEGFVDDFKKRGPKSDEQAELRQEIKGLLKEASSLSTPSTFAQAAKLRRLAAAKEKELIRKQEEHGKDKRMSYDLYSRALLAFKPFGKFLSWRAGEVVTGQIMVGIIPWLVLTSRVAKYFCQKLPRYIFQI